MNRNSLSISETSDDAAWDALVDRSPQGTVFSRSAFLRSLGMATRRFLVSSAGTVRALLAVAEDEQGHAVRVPFTPYQGILFVPDTGARERQRTQREFLVTEFIIDELTRRYAKIAMALSWKFEDIRPFLWHNHGIAGGRFNTQPRYTAILELQDVCEDSYPQQVRQCRRQELKKAAAWTIHDRASIDEFLRLYAETFARQDIALNERTLARVRRIAAQALREGYGRLSACETGEGIASMNLFLYDARRAYYLFAANSPQLRHSGAATRLMFDNIFEAKRRGLQELDFVGVNSPARGDFKLSFGPRLRLYFELDYAAPAGPVGGGLK